MNASAAFAIAWRELRAGARGFFIFLACLALGVGAIAAAGSAGEMFSRGVGGELSRILGGDLSLDIARDRADADLRDRLEMMGAVSEVVDVNVMASANDERRLVRVRGADNAYPLLGDPTLDPPISLDEALAQRDGLPGMVADAEILRLFDLQPGDVLEIGGRPFQLRAELESEPDRLDIGFNFAPRLITSLEAVEAAGFIGEGSLFRARYRLLLDDELADRNTLDESLEAELEPEGWNVTTRDEIGDQFDELLGQLSVFLSVAGLAALLAGGLGVHQAVTTFLSTRTGAIAALKSLGAEAATLRLAYGLQILALALIGALIGVVIGALAPLILASVFGDQLPLPAEAGIYPVPLLLAMLYGLLAALAFALPAIGRARATPPAALFGGAARAQAATPWLERLAGLAVGAAFIGLAVGFSPAPMTAGFMLGFALAVFLLLWMAAYVLRWLARRLSRLTRGGLRLALMQLGGPASVAPIAAPALGLGLSLLAVVTLVQHNLVTQIRDTAPSQLPSIAFNMIPGDRVDEFDAVAARAGVRVDDPAAYLRAPFLLGRVTRLKGEALDRDQVAQSEQWVIDGETRITVVDALPANSQIVDGQWWASDYAGPPLVSIEADAAQGLGLEVGDTIAMRILGREITAELANTRTIDWGDFGVNVAIVFAPGTLEAANPAWSAIVRSEAEIEDELARSIGDTFPEVTIFRIRERLEAAAEIFEKTTIAIDAVAGVVAAAGALVMLGAFAAAARRRVTDAALLKTFGVTPGGVLRLFALEFGLVGAMAAALALALAAPPAWWVITQQLEAVWVPDWGAVGLITLFAVGAAAAGGALVARTALAVPAARALRDS